MRKYGRLGDAKKKKKNGKWGRKKAVSAKTKDTG